MKAFWDYLDQLADTFLRYPGWIEVVASIGGGIAYTLIMIFSGVGIGERPGLRVATFLLPSHFWEVMGVVLASGHSWALIKFNTRQRAYWTAGSTVFWCHFTFGIAIQNLLDGKPFSVLLGPAIILVLVLLVLTWRLWKGYE